MLRVEEIGDDYVMGYRYDTNGNLASVSRYDINADSSSILYAQTNTRGDVISLYDGNGATRVKYTYDSWGKLISATDASGNALGENSVGVLNSVRYRGYVYDSETGLYYLQSRYYDSEVGRFLNADDVRTIGYSSEEISYNIFAYCENNPIMNFDQLGFWAENYRGFSWKNKGFNLYVCIDFLSRSFCIRYAKDIIRLRGKWYWWGKGYKSMSATRIAQELWFHALVYYVGSPIKYVLNCLGVSWNKLNSYLDSAYYMEINNDDNRAWLFSLTWYAASTVKLLLFKRIGYKFPYSYIRT